ncbi:hypothetical protein ACIBBE_24245 [Streptomyces sp. NPDC051644]|uniref:hypothetical protein n=1 Tax=Streptomyces sp. NPDC051644 TaxID=3365666 RepID=UPI0037972AC1
MPIPARPTISKGHPVTRAVAACRAPLAVALLVGVLAACGSYGGSRVSGLRDDLRYVSKKTVPDTRPRMVSQCTTGTKRVKHTSTSGTGKFKKTSVWYSNEPTRSCKKIQRGIESYDRVVRQAQWCVELDDVNGSTDRDDVWFEVDSGTYNTAVKAREGDKLSFTPLRTGC